MAPLATAFVRVRPTLNKNDIVDEIKAAGPAAERAAADVGKRAGTALSRQTTAAMQQASIAGEQLGERVGRVGGALSRGVAGGTVGYVLGSALTNAVPSRFGSALTAGTLGATAGFAVGGPLGGAVGALGAGGVSLANSFNTKIDPKTSAEQMTAIAAASLDGRAKVQALVDTMNKAAHAGDMGGQAKKLRDVAQGALDAADDMRRLDLITRASTVSLTSHSDAMRNAVTSAVQWRGAQDSLRASIAAAAKVAVDNGRALRGNSDAALANRAALAAEADAVLGVIDAMQARGAGDVEMSATMAALTKVVETQATKMYGNKAAVDALLRSLGLIPGEAAAATAAFASVNAAVTADKAVSPGMIAAAQKAAKSGKSAADSFAKAFTTGYTTPVDKAAESAAKKAEAAAKRAADAAKRAFDEAKQHMQSDLDSIKSDLLSTTQSLEGFAAITNNMKTQDTLGAPMTGNVFSNRRDAAEKMKQFGAAYTKLARMGLNADDLHQFIQAGPDALPAMQQILAAGRGGVRQINRLESQITGVSRGLAAADTSRQDASTIHRDLQTLPPKLGRELARNLNKVHIHVNLTEVDHRDGVKVLTGG